MNFRFNEKKACYSRIHKMEVRFIFIFIIFINRILIKGIQKSTIPMVLNAEEFSCDLNFESNVFKVNLAI
jgi:hypothetical protein